MKVLRKLWDDFIPKYARRPLLIVLIWNCAVFFLTKLVISEDRYHFISGGIEDRIPLVTAFVYIYILAYVQWILGYIVIARDSREWCYRFLSAELIAKTITLACFLIYPTAIHRPEIQVNGLDSWILSLIYKVDNPAINLFPSVHCLASWISFRGALGLKRMPRWYAWVQLGFTLLVFASVLLVKQHAAWDIPGGVAVVEIGVLLSKRFRTGRIFEHLEKKPKE